MRLVAYTRVSTDLQAEKGFGLDVQRAQIRAWASRSGHHVVGWYTDEGVSGTTETHLRKGLVDALGQLEANRAHGLVVARLDRLARLLTVQEATLARIWTLSCDAFTADLGVIPKDDPTDPMRTALRQMVGVFGQLERGMINARLRNGRQAKADQGGYAGGAPPFGLRAHNGSLIPDDDESATATRIYELARAGLSSRAIARVLNTEVRPAKRGGAWSSPQVCRVLRMSPATIAVAS